MAWSASPYAVRNIVNELSASHAVTKYVWWLAAAFFVLRMLDEIFWRFAEMVMRSFKPQLVESVRLCLFRDVLKKPHSYFTNTSSGRVGHWINQSTDTVNEIIDTTIWSVWGRVIGLVLSAVFLCLAHWKLALLFTLWLVLLFIFSIRRGRELETLVRLQSDEVSATAGLVVDSLGNNLSVRVFNAADREVNMLKNRQKEIVKRWGASWRQSFATNVVKGQSTAIVNGIAMILILHMYTTGTVQVGDIVLFLAYFSDASTSLWELAWSLDAYYRYFGNLNNALGGLNAATNERQETKINNVSTKDSTLMLSGVSFAYPDQSNEVVLHDVNLLINKAEKVGVVGHSGAGKTTLISLLLNFYEISKGKYEIGGVPVASMSPQQVRDLIAYVPQDTNLFNRSILENIAYARPGATKQEVVEAAKRAQAYDFIVKLPNGFETVIGERGVKLSGGQRQRIAIARALLKDAPILVLDEATSALDSVSEQSIQKALVDAMEHRTSIVVAHRLSTLRHMDRIVVFDAGTIAEQGTHDDLIAADGIYADLWRRQKDGFIGE